MSGVRIGINPLTWSNDDMPELGAAISLQRCLHEGREAGYEGFELGHKFPRDASALGPLLASHGLDLVSGWYSCRLLERSLEEEIAAVEAHLSLLTALGCEVMVCAEVSGAIHGQRQLPLSGRPQMTEREWPLFASRLAGFAAYLHSRHMRLAYHQHMGTVIQSSEDIERLLAATGSEVELLLDTGHLTYAGADPVQIVERFGERIGHVHCKDIRAGVLQDALQRDQSFLDAVLDGVFTVPGDGAVNFRAVLARLARRDYRGWLVVEAEQDPDVAHPLTYARMGFACLRPLVDEYFGEKIKS